MEILKKAALFAFALLILSASYSFAADIDIFSFADSISGKIVWDPRTETGEIVTSENIYTFKPDIPWIILNSSKKIKTSPIYIKEEMPMVPESLAVLLKSGRTESAKKMPTGHKIALILIDPGHGGKDPGAVGTHQKEGKTIKVVEKDVVLKVAKELYSRLSRQYPDKKIMMTRTGDTYPSLDDRVVQANNVKLGQNETMLFISIHANASLRSKNAAGFEVWYLPPEYRRSLIDSKTLDDQGKELFPILNTIMEEEVTMESILLAKSILRGMDEKIGKDIPNRGLKEESWFVVRNAKMPAVLIEIGFVTNMKEAFLLNDPLYLKKIAEGIYNGIKDFIFNFEYSSGE